MKGYGGFAKARRRHRQLRKRIMASWMGDVGYTILSGCDWWPCGFSSHCNIVVLYSRASI